MSATGERVEFSLTTMTHAAVLWNAGLVTLINAGQFAVMLVLVRLLSPDVYGQFGLLMAIVGFVYVFSAQSFVDYSLQIRNEASVNYQDLFTTSVYVNFLLCLLVNFAALGIDTFPEYANLQLPLHFLSIGFLLQPGRAIRIAMLKRQLNWKRIRSLHAIGFIFSAIFAIPLAYSGAGIYALILPTFITPLPFLYDIFVDQRWRPSWTWDLKRMSPALKFGLNRQLSGAITTGRRLLESTVLVQVAGFAAFGVYGRAIALAEIACTRVLGNAIEALYPSLTKIEPGTARFRKIGAVVLSISAWLSIPIAVLMGELATTIVTAIYGEQWLEVIPLVGWATASAAAGAIHMTLYKLLLAHQQQRHCIWSDVILIAGTATSLYFLLPFGLIGYIQGLFVTQLVLIAVSAFFLVSERGIEVAAVRRALFPPILGALCASSIFVNGTVDTLSNLLGYLSIVLWTAFYITVYLITMRLLFTHSLREIISYMPKHTFLRKLLFLGSTSYANDLSRTSRLDH